MRKVFKNLRIKSHLYAIIGTTSASTFTNPPHPASPCGAFFKGPSEAAEGGEASDVRLKLVFGILWIFILREVYGKRPTFHKFSDFSIYGFEK